MYRQRAVFTPARGQQPEPPAPLFVGERLLLVARPQHAAPARGVPVREPAREHDGDDLHVAVRVRAEARAGRDVVLVDDPQAPEAHVARVVVVAEREGVAAVEPPRARPPALPRRSYRYHLRLLPARRAPP